MRSVLALALLGSVAACSSTEPAQPTYSPQLTSDTQEMTEKINRIGKEIGDLLEQCNAIFASLYIGMPETSVHNQQPHGRRAVIHTTQTSNGIHEQWVWGDGSGRYVYFDNGVLTAIQN